MEAHASIFTKPIDPAYISTPDLALHISHTFHAKDTLWYSTLQFATATPPTFPKPTSRPPCYLTYVLTRLSHHRTRLTSPPFSLDSMTAMQSGCLCRCNLTPSPLPPSTALRLLSFWSIVCGAALRRLERVEEGVRQVPSIHANLSLSPYVSFRVGSCSS
ncbi:hypothetical protein BC938DRAFT_478677 [Jimgerdemannia flammicorona]|uniref:Uncharacterized protein n=1 Tax=Jimgerdemannia flammicorona TaxID=994334 RepID=A0A433QMG7_9FUNG|nr:hypothetical protein BC938DRAFT_478677 [Jimgerdemannia flammicorona]RUS30975.1 hypothetical protein BC938DRAFT_478677 [Jimgerdemannia flammicorona]RUS30976.1 hypothetical protein BC938DRAFT_478677 [Jimgerdemannia flammicorona]